MKKLLCACALLTLSAQLAAITGITNFGPQRGKVIAAGGGNNPSQYSMDRRNALTKEKTGLEIKITSLEVQKFGLASGWADRTQIEKINKEIDRAKQDLARVNDELNRLK